MCYASLCIGNGAAFYTTEESGYINLTGKRLPSVGVISAGLTKCVEKDPICVGKPNPYLVNLICESEGLDKKTCLLIGDKLETDIQLGINANIDSLLVFTGETTKLYLEEHLKTEKPIVPTYVAKNLNYIESLL